MPSAEPAPAKAGDLVRLPQLAVLALERLDALALVCRWTKPNALVRLGLPHPVTQRLARAADLLGNRAERRPLRGVLALVVQHHPNRAGTDLGGIRGNSLRHGSILSRVGASGKPGAVQSTSRCTGAPPALGHGTASVSARRLRVEWSGTGRSRPSSCRTEPISPSVWRSAKRNTARRVSAVVIARSE